MKNEQLTMPNACLPVCPPVEDRQGQWREALRAWL